MSIIWIAITAQAAAQPRVVAPPPPPIIYTVPAAPPLPKGSTAPVPVGNPGDWVTTNDYPASALREEREGIVGFMVTISPAGWVKNCEITVSSGTPALDEATCRLVKMRATFKPAVDAKGVPTEGWYSNRVRWVIPDEMPPPSPGTMVISTIIEKDGTRSNCTLTRTGLEMDGAPPNGPVPCHGAKIDPPYTNAKGEPIRKRIIETMTLSIEDVKE